MLPLAGADLLPVLQDRPIDFHRLLLSDSVRTGRFQEAISRSVHPGDVVVDVGAGSGILSLFAAKAGAKRVFALEGNPRVAAFAEAAVAQNGVADIITVLRGDSFSAALTEPVDVIVSECIGWAMYVGDMFSAVIDVRDRLLRPGGRVIPRRVTAWAAPVESQALCDYVTFFERSRPYGFDFSGCATADVVLCSTLNADALLGGPVQLAEARLAAGYPNEVIDSRATFVALRAGTLHGFALWFDAELCDDVVLTTRPGAPATIWRQVFIGAGDPVAMQPGDVIGLDVRLQRSLVSFQQRLEWYVTVPGADAGDGPVRSFASCMAPSRPDLKWVSDIDGNEWLSLRRRRALSR